MSSKWEEERIFVDGDEFFDALEEAIDGASSTIEFETYIFENGPLGERIIAALIRAAKRGISIRLIVDGVGSWGWPASYSARLSEARISHKIFHQLPLDEQVQKSRIGSRLGKIIVWFRRMNHRNHRKVCIIDQQLAFLGSMNVWKVHLRSLSSNRAWRDTGISVKGPEVKYLEDAFDALWSSIRGKYKARWRWWRDKSLKGMRTLVRLNATRKLRVAGYKDLRRRILVAEKVIWITNSYFVPPGSLLRALGRTATRGIDVRILVPQKSDVFFMPWVTAAFFFGLLSSGVRVFEYLPSVLHAKSLIIDNWAIVGSSNLNSRSILHDLEADVVVTHEESKVFLTEQFLRDLELSREVKLEDWRKRKLYQRLMGRIFLLFRYWL